MSLKWKIPDMTVMLPSPGIEHDKQEVNTILPLISTFD